MIALAILTELVLLFAELWRLLLRECPVSSAP
jgi:hypothetical protein